MGQITENKKNYNYIYQFLKKIKVFESIENDLSVHCGTITNIFQ